MDQVFDAVPLWSACPDGRIAVLNPDSSELRWYDARGAFNGPQDLAFSRPEVTEADIRRYVSLRVAMLASGTDLDTAGPDTRRLIERTVADLLGQLPRIAPFTRLRCDGANRIWLQLFGTDPDPRGLADAGSSSTANRSVSSNSHLDANPCISAADPRLVFSVTSSTSRRLPSRDTRANSCPEQRQAAADDNGGCTV